ncbi:MAG: hypothetical protein IJR14_00270 [Synergistaceae bacterium]|nr:hypothetical protein [Synergistaceae bacterium]
MPQRDGRVRLIGLAAPDDEEILAHVSKTSGCRVVWLQMGSQTRGQGGAALAYVWRGDLPRSFDDEETIRDRMFDAQLLLRGYA